MQRKLGRELYLCSEMVDVVVSQSRSLPANLEEISEHSLVLLIDEEIPRGANIQIVCNTQILNGVVETITADELLGWYIRVRLASYFPAQNSIIPSRPASRLGVNAEAVTCKNGIAKYVETIEARKSEH